MHETKVDPETLLRMQREIVATIRSLNQQLKAAIQTNQQIESILNRSLRSHPHNTVSAELPAVDQPNATELAQLLSIMAASLATAEASEKELKRRRATAYAIAIVAVFFILMMGLCMFCYIGLTGSFL